MKVSLLQFFREGHFHGIKLGVRRNEVEAVLGKPDLSVPGHSDSKDYAEAAVWYYAGVQFSFFDLKEQILGDIGFKPFYLLPHGYYRDLKTEKTELDLWMFNQADELKIEELRNGLISEKIDFQDTGLESIIFNPVIQKHELLPYDPNGEEAFGTLVLRSGIQVRYADNSEILRVQIGGEGWMFKGKEQSITW